MSGTALASVFPIGPRITAQVLGLPFAQYRPTSATVAVVSPVNLLATINAWITADPKLMGGKPFAYGKPVGFAGVDPALTQVGDYLVGSITVGGPVETFFIASQDIPQPIQVVRCNRVVTVSRPGGQNPGPGYYGGDLTATETPLGVGWPAAITDKGRRQSGEVKLPGDMDLPWVEILLPASFPVQIESMDVLLDDQAQPVRYLVSAVEQTPLGWRLMARAAVP